MSHHRSCVLGRAVAAALIALIAGLMGAATPVRGEGDNRAHVVHASRFTVPAAGARAQVAVGDHVVFTAAATRLVTHDATDGRVVREQTLPCAALDLRARGDDVTVLCADRVLFGANDEGVLFASLVEPAAPQLGTVTAFEVDTVFGDRWAVGFDDGRVVIGRRRDHRVTWHQMFCAAQLCFARALHIDNLMFTVVGVTDDGATVPLSFTADARTGPIDVFELVEEPGGRSVVHSDTRPDAGIVGGTFVPQRSLAALPGAIGLVGFTVDDISRDSHARAPVSRLCTSAAGQLECFARGRPAGASASAVVSGGAIVFGVGALAGAPFLLQALAPSTRGASFAVVPIAALGGLLATVGVGGVGGVALGGAALIFLALQERSYGDGTFFGDLNAEISNTADECMAGVITGVAIASLAVAIAGIGLGALAFAAMPRAETALGGAGPASSPFWLTAGASTAGAVTGAAVALVMTLPFEDPQRSEEQIAVDLTLQAVATGALVLGGGAIGGAVGYALAHGP